MKDLNELFLHTLKDVYHAEKQILRALPKMARASSSPELRAALEHHKEETQGQVERLEQVFESLDKRARGVPCEAIQGIIEEARSLMEEADEPEVRDAGIIAAAQAVEHYEIARYGTLCEWAAQLDYNDVKTLLGQTLQEEKNADTVLTKLATAKVNKKAA